MFLTSAWEAQLLRKIAVALVVWLCRRFEITLLDETRIPNGVDAVARGQRWQAFANEDGGLYDMIEVQRKSAFEAYSETRPDQEDERVYLALSDRCWRQLKARVDSVIQTGILEQNAAGKKSEHVELRKSV